MKRIAALMLALAVCLLAGLALAEELPVARSGSMAAYVDGAGQLFLPGNVRAVNQASADRLLSIDPYRVLFTSEQADGTSDLYMIDLGTFAETRLARGVHAAAMADEDTLYYVPSASRTQLWRMSMKDMTPRLAYTETEPIDRLINTAEGLVFDRVDGMGAMVYVPLTDRFERYSGGLPTATLLTDSYELTLTDGDLVMRDITSRAEEHIDTGVQAFTVMNGSIYYLANTGSAVRLKGYDPAAMTWQVVLTVDPDMERQLTATGEKLFMLDSSRQIYTVNLTKGSLDPYRKVNDPASYNLPRGYTATGLKILGMDGQLNVYAELSEASAQPNFSFIEFTSTSDTLSPVYRLLETYSMEGETAAWTFVKPAVQYSPLSRGSRGEAVRAIQQPLYDLGYYDYYIDGIFGPRTQYAVELVQMDMNVPVTGIADSDLQRRLLNGDIPKYDAYMALTRGNRGMRVQIMQETLRDLGYLADSADGIFGGNTQRAVQRFQSENGLKMSDGATREMLKLLYSGDARRCASFIDLYRGNTGYRVRELNNRLEELYYLEDNPGSSYTTATAEAIRAFQRRAGLEVNGNATEYVQRRLFSVYAPEAAGYITLRRGDENSRVSDLQIRLRDLGYYSGSISGYFGSTTEKAVKLFQRRVDLNVTGVATVRTQQLLFRRDAPEYVEPTVIGDPVITVDPYAYREAAIYYITDDVAWNDYVTFNWYAEGDVASYRVRIRSQSGRTVFDEETLLSRTGVTIDTLDYDNVYTMTVTAYPEDGNSSHVTSSSLRFCRVETPEEPVVPEIGTVSTPEIRFEKVTRVQDGVQYVDPGKITLRWHADGELDHYEVELLDSDGETVLTLSTTDENAAMKGSTLTVGEFYRLFVYAIPTNGTLEDAEVNVEIFALEDASIPTPSPEPPEEEIPLAEPSVKPEVTPEPTEIVESTPVPTIAPEDLPEALPEETPAPTEEVPEEAPQAEPQEQPAEAEGEPVEAQDGQIEGEPEPTIPGTPAAPEEAPQAETQEEPAEVEGEPVEAEGVQIEGEPEPTPPETTVGIPTITFETLVGTDNGVSYLTGNPISMIWQSEGDVAGYEITVLTHEGNAVAHATTDKNSLSVNASNIASGEVYTLVVTTIPNGGSAENGATAMASFALYTEPAGAEEAYAEQYDAEAPAPQEESYAEEAPAPQEESYVEEVSVPQEESYAEEAPVRQEETYVEEAPTPQEETYVEQYDEEEPAQRDEGDYEDEPYVEESREEASYENDYAEDEGAGNEGMNADTISQMQSSLVSLGWLTEGSYESGILDGATLQAVRSFQSWYNENYGGELPYAESSVDSATLSLLLN